MAQVIPFEEIPTSKKVPSSAKILELLGKSDLVKERYTVSVQPYSGQGAGIGAGLNNKITFKMFNNADYADLSTAYLNFTANFTGTLDHINFEENVLSWFNLVRVLVNDQVLEEVNNFNIWANLITFASMGKSYYESAGSFMGCYRHSKYLHGGPRGLVQVTPATSVPNTLATIDFGNQVQGSQTWEQFEDGGPSWVPTTTQANPPTGGSGGNDSWVNGTMRVAGGYQWTAPLSGYLGLFSIDKYFPLRSVSSITLELNLPTTIYGVCFDNLLPAAPPASLANVTLQLNNCYLHYDCVKMSDAYYELMDQELLDPNGLGVQFTINTVESTNISVPASVNDAPKVYIASKGTRFLKSVWVVHVPQFTYNQGIAPPSSVFVTAGFRNAQLVVNSKRYPQYRIDNRARAFQELQKSTNKYHSVVGDSVITYRKYQLDPSNAGNLSAAADADCEYATHILGFNLEQVLDSPEITLQGENTLTAGFQIQLEITNAPSNACNAYMFPHFAKVLRIKGGAISILN